MQLAEFFVALGIDTNNDDFKRAERHLDRVRDAAQQLIVGLIGVRGAFAVVGKIALDSIEHLDGWSRRVAESPQALEELGFAARQMGVDAETAFSALEAAAGIAQTQLLEVRELTGPVGRAFQELGFTTIQQFRGVDGEVRGAFSLFEDFVERLRRVENGTRRDRLASQIFGSGIATGLTPLLEPGAGSIEGLRQQARDLGITVNDEDIRNAREFRAAWASIVQQGRSLARVLGRDILPQFTAVLREFTAFYQANRQLVETDIVAWFRSAEESAALATGWLFRLARGLRRVIEDSDTLKFAILALSAAWVGSLVVSVATAALSLLRILPTFRTLTAGAQLLTLANIRVGLSWLAAAAPAAAFGAALISVGLLIDDFVVALQGGDSAVGRFLDAWDSFLNSDVEGSILYQGLQALAQLLNELLLGFGAALTYVFGGASGRAEASEFFTSRLRPILSAGIVNRPPNAIAAVPSAAPLPLPFSTNRQLGPLNVSIGDVNIQGTTDMRGSELTDAVRGALVEELRIAQRQLQVYKP